MCGISGIFHLNGQPVEKNDIETMNQTMIHRGPDGQGIFTQSEIGLGHRRLSIIDLEAGKQPMSNADGSIQVVFNGEIYNYLELKKELEAKGYQFRTRSDTESIIYAYEAYGDRFVEKLRGMFAIGLWDSRNKKLILTRDRVGKKPLYYYLDQHRIVFASELKAVIALPGIPKELDIQALDAYLSFGYVPSPLSIFKHIRKLPPASVAVCTAKSFNVREYWNLDMTQPDLSWNDASAIEELEAIFDESVRLRLMSDVPLGAFLSGGVDS
ncbi:MAG TPA: asparagine synthase (glutamine-hydrolyzing), partial [Desulfobacteraceae bacterium]|nr:asparagine synthase (glutamine-hydrolyzing) [Desulfobacteraceae bacterium]